MVIHHIVLAESPEMIPWKLKAAQPKTFVSQIVSAVSHIISSVIAFAMQGNYISKKQYGSNAIYSINHTSCLIIFEKYLYPHFPTVIDFSGNNLFNDFFH